MGFTYHVVLSLSTEKKVSCTLLAQDDTITTQSSQHVVVVTAKRLKLLWHNQNQLEVTFHCIRVRVGVRESANSCDKNTERTECKAINSIIQLDNGESQLGSYAV
jgi:hypothetical protein